MGEDIAEMCYIAITGIVPSEAVVTGAGLLLHFAYYVSVLKIMSNEHR